MRLGSMTSTNGGVDKLHPEVMFVNAGRLLHEQELGGAAYKMGPASRGSELSS